MLDHCTGDPVSLQAEFPSLLIVLGPVWFSGSFRVVSRLVLVASALLRVLRDCRGTVSGSRGDGLDGMPMWTLLGRELETV